MFEITDQMARDQVNELESASKTRNVLFFDDFIKTLIPHYTGPEFQNPNNIIRIPKSLDEMLDGDLEPARIINLESIRSEMYYDSFPMWLNESPKEYSLHGFGLIDNNKSKPSLKALWDQSPHMKLGGATGHGKSVTLNDIIVGGLMVHPPWLVQYYFNDPKIVELKPYASYHTPIPHVNTVAATEDPEFTISMLEYLIEVMNKRNTLFEKLGVKNIEAFNEKTGLSLWMLVLILDEVRSMYLNAMKKKSWIDHLIMDFAQKARNAGGRMILASQSVVSEMSPDTLRNINIRATLGCQAEVSTKIIGNPGGAINFGKMGRLTINENPSMADAKDNVYTVSPFIPDNKGKGSRTIYEIFDHVNKIWALMGGGRIEELSFYDDKKKITKGEFEEYVYKNAAIDKIFLGEASFIYKEPYKFYHTSLIPKGEYDVASGYNFLCISPLANMRFTMVATLLLNYSAIKKRRKCSVHVYTPLREYSHKIKKLGYAVDNTFEAIDVGESFGRIAQSIYMRYILVLTDSEIFAKANKDIPPNILEWLKKADNFDLNALPEIMQKRTFGWLQQLRTPRGMAIFGLPELTEKTLSHYLFQISGMVTYVSSFLGCETRQVTIQSLPLNFSMFFGIEQMRGFEVKTDGRALDATVDVLKMGPLYNIYISVVCDSIPNSGSYIAPAFKHLLFYRVPDASINPYKIRDFWPEMIPSITWVYSNTTLPEKFCFKLKFPMLIEEGGK